MFFLLVYLFYFLFDSELLVNYEGYLRIQREEFYTLGDPSKLIHVSVVDYWCLLLNENEKNKKNPKSSFLVLVLV